MDIELSDRVQKQIAEMVESGRVSSEREAIDAAFASLAADDRAVQEFFEDRSEEWWAELREMLQEGIDSADAGELYPLTDELIEDINRRGRERLRARNARSA